MTHECRRLVLNDGIDKFSRDVCLVAPAVLYDSRVTDGMEPTWLTRDFADEHEQTAQVGDTSMDEMEIHLANKPAGELCIGGNNAPGVGSNYMYVVAHASAWRFRWTNDHTKSMSVV